MNYSEDNPRWRNTLEALFEPQVKWITVLNGRTCPTGLYAIGYPEDRYGYDVYTMIDYDQIPELMVLAEKKGFELWAIHDYEADKIGDNSRCFEYRLPGAKWWTDFPELNGIRAVNSVGNSA